MAFNLPFQLSAQPVLPYLPHQQGFDLIVSPSMAA